MDNKLLDIEGDKTQSLEVWVNEVITPILEAIGYISSKLETLYQELK